MRLLLPVLGLVVGCDSAEGASTAAAAADAPSAGSEGGEGEGEPDARLAMGPERTGEVALEYDRAVTEGNVLKGFFTSHTWGTPTTDFPTSMEFEYVSFARLMPAQGTVAVTDVVEPLLAAAAERGNHLVIRPYLDYPGRPSGVPVWLVDAGVVMREYPEEDGGRSPDYESPVLRAALTDFIAAFGAAFDGDPRLGIVQLGLLGHWGEWHTYTHEEWFASAQVQDEVMRAYDAAFPTCPSSQLIWLAPSRRGGSLQHVGSAADQPDDRRRHGLEGAMVALGTAPGRSRSTRRPRPRQPDVHRWTLPAG